MFPTVSQKVSFFQSGLVVFCHIGWRCTTRYDGSQKHLRTLTDTQTNAHTCTLLEPGSLFKMRDACWVPIGAERVTLLRFLGNRLLRRRPSCGCEVWPGEQKKLKLVIPQKSSKRTKVYFTHPLKQTWVGRSEIPSVSLPLSLLFT